MTPRLTFVLGRSVVAILCAVGIVRLNPPSAWFYVSFGLLMICAFSNLFDRRLP